MWRILRFAAFLGFFHQVLGLKQVVQEGVLATTGCPRPQNVKPCVCFALTSSLICKNITDTEVLRNVFRHSGRHTYKEVSITDSHFEHFPHEMFEIPTIRLYLRRVTLTDLFDRTPNDVNHLEKLHLEDFKVMNNLFWQLLSPLKGLRKLVVKFMTVNVLDSTFSVNAPRTLEKIVFEDTETMNLTSGVLANFTNLDTVMFNGGKIYNLTRDIFPIPFNGKVFSFNDQRLKTIPAGLFSHMPNLAALSLRRNQLASLPKEAFDSPESASRMEFLLLGDNPLKCDCLIEYLVKSKPGHFEGQCEAPKRLHGRYLITLSPRDLDC